MPTTDEPVVRRTVDADEALLPIVVDALSAAMDIDTRELPPLERSVDTEALETVAARPDTTVTFEHQGFPVTVTDDGAVLVYPRDA